MAVNAPSWCADWKRNRRVNPTTGRTLTSHSKVADKLDAICNAFARPEPNQTKKADKSKPLERKSDTSIQTKTKTHAPKTNALENKMGRCEAFVRAPWTVSFAKFQRLIKRCPLPAAVEHIQKGSRGHDKRMFLEDALSGHDAALHRALRIATPVEDALAAVKRKYGPTGDGYGGFDLAKLMATDPLRADSHWRGTTDWVLLGLLAVLALTKRACVLIPPNTDVPDHALEWSIRSEPAKLTVGDTLSSGTRIWARYNKLWRLALVHKTVKVTSSKTRVTFRWLYLDDDLDQRNRPIKKGEDSDSKQSPLVLSVAASRVRRSPAGRLNGNVSFVRESLEWCPHHLAVVPFPLSLRTPDDTVIGHSNLLLADFRDGTVTRLDPKGQTIPEFQPDALDAALRVAFESADGKTTSWKYGVPEVGCTGSTKFGPQMWQGRENVPVPNGPGGFCGAWSLYLVHQQLLHPLEARATVMQNAQDWLLAQVKAGRLPNLTAFIAAYATAIQEAALALMDAVVPLKSGARTLSMYPTDDGGLTLRREIQGNLFVLLAYIRRLGAVRQRVATG